MCFLLVTSFLALVVLYLMLAIFTQYEMINVCMFGIPFLHVSASLWCIFFYSKNELGKLPWITFIWDLQTKLRIFSMSFLSLAADSPCGVWDRGWTTRLLYDGIVLDLLQPTTCTTTIYHRLTLIYVYLVCSTPQLASRHGTWNSLIFTCLLLPPDLPPSYLSPHPPPRHLAILGFLFRLLLAFRMTSHLPDNMCVKNRKTGCIFHQIASNNSLRHGIINLGYHWFL